MNPKAFLQAAVALAILVMVYSLAALIDNVGMSDIREKGVHNVE